MYPNNLVTFCIPTFNRAKILDDCLSKLINTISIYGFCIVISDNASSDNTIEIIEKHKKLYSNIFYIRQNTNIGLDRNFEMVLKMSKTTYSWLFGDYAEIVQSELNDVLQLLIKKQYELIIVNSKGRVTNIPSKEYNNIALMLDEIGWHMTFMSSLIFGEKVIKNANFQRFYGTYLIHHGISFEYLSKNLKSICYWHDRNVITGTTIVKTNTWVSSSFKIFGQQWTNMVLSFPPIIPLEAKLKCIKNHGRFTGFFKFSHIARLKVNGWLKINDCFKYKLYWKYVSDTPWIVLLIVALIPDYITRRNNIIYNTFRLFRKTNTE